MNAAAPWLDHFVMHIPCNSDTACATTSIKVPDDNSYFTYYKDQNHAGGEKAIRWDGNTILFKYRDLQVNILAGRIFGSNRMVLDLNAANKGTLDSNVATTVALYWSSDSNSLDDPLGSLSVPPLLPGQAQAYYDVNIAKAGWIIAIINPDPPHNINECPQGNIAKIKCTSGTKVEYYQLKVQVWRR
ncbi:MAG: hypothetical protein NT067_06110 [Candidatus Diapherotrites archaeon]|nr:hypothetical protein [Candidatus Diapherotrites archaeon]